MPWAWLSGGCSAHKHLNSSVNELRTLRDCSVQWSAIWNSVVQMCAENNIVIHCTSHISASSVSDCDNASSRQTRRCRVTRMPRHMQDYFTLETVGSINRHTIAAQVAQIEQVLESHASSAISSAEHKNRVSVFLVLIDNILSEMEKRFGQLQNSFFHCSSVTATNFSTVLVIWCSSAYDLALPWLSVSWLFAEAWSCWLQSQLLLFY